MRVVAVAMVLLIGGAGFAQASCADDLTDLRAKVEREQKQKPTAQTAAAMKELKRADENANVMDEVDCYNAVARIRRALSTPPPEEPKPNR